MILFAAAAVTVIVALVAAVNPVSPLVVSDAVRVHAVPTVITTEVNVATAELAPTDVAPVRVHDEVMATVSDALEPVAGALETSSIVTAKLERVAPAVVVVLGPEVKARWVPTAAAAGDTATNARPASIRADVAVTATRDFITDPRDRRPSLRFIKLLIRISAFALPVRFEYLNMCFMGTSSSIGRGRELHLAVVLHLPVNLL